MSLSNILKKKTSNTFFILEPEEIIEKQSKDIDLFSFFRCFFSPNVEAWSAITDKEKMGHAFMLIEYLSIKEPQLMMMVQNMISPRIIDSLHLMFSTNYGPKSPGWMFMYNKVQKQKKHVVDLKKYDKMLIQTIINKYQLDGKDFAFIQEYESSMLENLLVSEQEALNQKKQK